MDRPTARMARQIAAAAHVFEQQRTGHGPQSVTVVLSDDTLVITLHGALSEAEKALAKNPEGAAQLQEFHRRLFASAGGALRQEIERITGAKVREATAEIEPNLGAVAPVFSSGTVVQVFLLADGIERGAWGTARWPEEQAPGGAREGARGAPAGRRDGNEHSE